jgi:hypothetical protein
VAFQSTHIWFKQICVFSVNVHGSKSVVLSFVLIMNAKPFCDLLQIPSQSIGTSKSSGRGTMDYITRESDRGSEGGREEGNSQNRNL